MAYNTKNIVRDASGAPIPQLFNPAADEYQPLEGTGGAHKTQLSGSTVPVAVTMQNAAAANGNGASLTVTGLGTAVLTVSGTFGATVNFESSNDGGTSWFPHLTTKMGDGAIANTTFTTGQYRLNVAGVDLVRARISGYVSGNVTVVGKTSAIVAPSKAIMVTGSNLVEQQNEGHAVAGVHTFADTIYSLEIFHSATRSQPFWVNTLQLYVPPGGWRSRIGGTPGTTVTATTLIGAEYAIGRLA